MVGKASKHRHPGASRGSLVCLHPGLAEVAIGTTQGPGELAWFAASQGPTEIVDS